MEVRDLKTKFFTVDGVVNALNGVSYSVDKGECLAIVGESGSGKTVGVLSILRLIQSPPGRIVGGSIFFKGTDLLALGDRALRDIRGGAIAVIFQDPMTSLNPIMRIGAQITETIMEHERLTHRQARAKAVELLAVTGIPTPAKRLDDYPHQFSGGMRQRVMIAIALSSSPQLIIADEPTTALDVTIQAQIVELVKKLQSELGTAVIWISHDLGVVARLADTVAVMYAGYIVETRGRVVRKARTSLHDRTSQLAAALGRARKDETAGHRGPSAKYARGSARMSLRHALSLRDLSLPRRKSRSCGSRSRSRGCVLA